MKTLKILSLILLILLIAALLYLNFNIKKEVSFLNLRLDSLHKSIAYLENRVSDKLTGEELEDKISDIENELEELKSNIENTETEYYWYDESTTIKTPKKKEPVMKNIPKFTVPFIKQKDTTLKRKTN